MNRDAYAVLKTWQGLKKVAAEVGENPQEGLTRLALTRWANTEAPLDKTAREAWSASLVGASLVDVAIQKQAAEGHWTEEEREFLETLNAQAALLDFERFSKEASLASLWQSPVARGVAAGTAIGAGYGAWKDDENRLRGAASYALPGAVLGGMAGHVYQGRNERLQDIADRQLKNQQAEAAQATAQAAAEAAQAKAQADARQKTISGAGAAFHSLGTGLQERIDDARRYHENVLSGLEMHARKLLESGDHNGSQRVYDIVQHLADPKSLDHFVQYHVDNPSTPLRIPEQLLRQLHPDDIHAIKGAKQYIDFIHKGG